MGYFRFVNSGIDPGSPRSPKKKSSLSSQPISLVDDNYAIEI